MSWRAHSSPDAALHWGVCLTFLVWALLWQQNQWISAPVKFSWGQWNANPPASHLASLWCRGSNTECPALFKVASPRSSCTRRVFWGLCTTVVLSWNCLCNLLIPHASSLLSYLLRKSLQLRLRFKYWKKSRALLAPLASFKGYLLWSHLFSFIFYSNENHYPMSSIFSLILPPWGGWGWGWGGG